MSERIKLDTLNRLNDTDFVRSLDGSFEDAPWVAEQAAAGRPSAAISALHDHLMASVRSAPTHEQIAFIAGHPDLAGKAARAGAIAPASIKEQAGLGLDRLSEDEFARFERLNS